MNLTEWVDVVAADLAVADVQTHVRAALEVTREVAHRVERPAAPVTLLLVGLAAGGDPARIPELLERVRGLLPPA